MNNAFGVAIAVICIFGGATWFAFPRTVSHFQEDEETTPAEAIWQIRVGGVCLFLFGLALMYSILTANGQPVEFIGV